MKHIEIASRAETFNFSMQKIHSLKSQQVSSDGAN